MNYNKSFLYFTFAGETIVVFLNMSAETLPNVVSRNTVAEIKGYEFPEQVAWINLMICYKLTWENFTYSIFPFSNEISLKILIDWT